MDTLERLGIWLGEGEANILYVQAAVSEIAPGTEFFTGDLVFRGEKPPRPTDLLRQMEGCVEPLGVQARRGGELGWLRTGDPRLEGLGVCEKSQEGKDCLCIQSAHAGCVIYDRAKRRK